MDQWWHVIALDRREKLRGYFRQGELLHDTKAMSHLVMALAVPVVPRPFGVIPAPDATASDLV